jgi:hypothetical protein
VIENLTNGFRFGRKATADAAGLSLRRSLLFGMVGKSVYFISKKPQSAQFEEELQRLFEDPNQLRGNLWLFYNRALFCASFVGGDFHGHSRKRRQF